MKFSININLEIHHNNPSEAYNHAHKIATEINKKNDLRATVNGISEHVSVWETREVSKENLKTKVENV